MMPVLVVMGVSGCGKSSLAKALAARLNVRFIEGDALHPAANIEKMSAGIPLDDDDRWPWLAEIGDALAESRVEGGAVAACSSLKRAYRDTLRRRAGGELLFVHLHGTRDVMLERMKLREGHFMPVALLDSQLSALEPLGADENTIEVDVNLPLHLAVETVLAKLA